MKKYTTLLFLFFLALSCQAQEKPAAVAPEIEVTDIVYCHQQGPCLPIVLRVYLGDPDADPFDLLKQFQWEFGGIGAWE
ncbi:MAG TPA: hypothetical protein PLU64_13690 [Saprospiraceae bacterium]|nr:hypothetical protein [Lewinellaceae bacterium]HQU60251.1 hypothetical protein [Saprospiraceae bacterium]